MHCENRQFHSSTLTPTVQLKRPAYLGICGAPAAQSKNEGQVENCREFRMVTSGPNGRTPVITAALLYHSKSQTVDRRRRIGFRNRKIAPDVRKHARHADRGKQFLISRSRNLRQVPSFYGEW